MLSEELTRYAAEHLEARRELLAPVIDAVDAAVAAAGDADEATLLRYLYGTLPLTDCLDTPPSVLDSYVRHALFLRREVAWCRELGEGLFVHYVLCPRINNEALHDCRATFWEALRERVAGLAAADAVREVNYWCAEMATYQTTDARTLGPLGMLASAAGRCGEESTFLVTALRSVGIPARQIYTPLWAHCDDNHAWVEAYTGDGWHYLGACEPEEELDRGWFTAASGRALMEETRLFSDFMDASVAGQDSGSVGSTRLQNVTASYAPCEPLVVRVTHAGAPVAAATVMVEVLNMAAWLPAATLATGEDGCVRLDLGLGTMRVHASTDELLGEVVIDTREQHEVEVALAESGIVASDGAVDDGAACGAAAGDGAVPGAPAANGTWHDVDVCAPADHPAPSRTQTPEQDERARARKAACDETRRARVAGFAAHASKLAARWPGSEHAFACALGNADEVTAFLAAGDDAGADASAAGDGAAAAHAGAGFPAGGEADRLELLDTLADKDFLDLRASVLESHLCAARSVRAEAEERLRAQGLSAADAHDAYVRYVLCPRTGFEELSCYRPFIRDFFDDAQRVAFADDPRALWRWIGAHLHFDGSEGLAKLVGTPEGALSSGQASAQTRAHVFVATCRTLGVAARLNPESAHPEFMEGGRFVPVEEAAAPETTRLTLSCPDPADAPAYGVTWSIGRLEPFSAANGADAVGFQTLDLEGVTFEDGQLALDLEASTYRVVTTTRLPNGNQQASELVFTVGEGAAPAGEVRADGDGVSLALRVRTPAASDMLNVIDLPAFGLRNAAGTALAPALGTHGTGVLAFCQEGMEPTEHLLNELRERVDELRAASLPVTLVVRDEAALADPTLSRTRAAMPEVAVAYDDFSELPERLARRTFANPELLPLTLLVATREDAEEGGLQSLYATSGYNVGTVDLLLRLAALARS